MDDVRTDLELSDIDKDEVIRYLDMVIQDLMKM